MIQNAVWDYRNPYEYLSRAGKTDFPPLMITCAITGEFYGKEYNENFPETIDEQVEAVYQAYQEGATAVHIHARDPQHPSRPSADKNVFSEINERVRKRCPGLIIANSTAGAPNMPVEQKLACLFADCKPDMASLNCGPMMVKGVLKERPESLGDPHPEMPIDLFLPRTYGDVHAAAKAMLDAGVKPEIEVFHPGHFWVVNSLIEQGLVKAPYLVELILGIQMCSNPTIPNVLNMIQELPKDSLFMVAGWELFQLPLTTFGILMGGHVRVGLEDNIYYRKGELAASNAQLVSRIRRISEEMNRPVATHEQARQILGLDS